MVLQIPIPVSRKVNRDGGRSGFTGSSNRAAAPQNVSKEKQTTVLYIRQCFQLLNGGIGGCQEGFTTGEEYQTEQALSTARPSFTHWKTQSSLLMMPAALGNKLGCGFSSRQINPNSSMGPAFMRDTLNVISLLLVHRMDDILPPGIMLSINFGGANEGLCRFCRTWVSFS
ncbi:hypothetical protein AVEN_240205-1 [Araneus ventricosus]|uniref:Uncharacterized protein n=1 Tax=Araneus ventricosus TaxID=182803 RepID=A0A4Y2R3U7_ARAVE|nr:hypothetical protein AVEN_240205-1 [Araneus ventricosus]